MRPPRTRTCPWSLAWLLCVLMLAWGSTASAQDDDEEATTDATEADDDEDDAEDDDAEGDDGEGDDGERDAPDEAADEDDVDDEPTAEDAHPYAIVSAEVEDEKAEGDVAAASKSGVDVLGWRQDDLSTLLGEEESYPRLDLGAYVRGGVGFTVRPNALPADEIEYGFSGRAGLRVNGAAHRMWRARMWLEFRAYSLPYVESVDIFDPDNDGVGFSATPNDNVTTRVQVEQAVAAFVPWEFLSVEAGVQRIPFTLQQQSKNTATLFPNRALANNLFLSGSDVGALIRGNFADGIFLTSLGVWDGVSLGLGVPFATPRGVVLSYRADVNPFGAFPFGEGDKERGPFRLGIGGGVLWRPTTIFDARTGTEPRTVQDIRWSASLRMGWAGLFFAAEYFRRHQIDNFTFRPQLADGAYGQLAYYFVIADTIGLEPSFRAGFVNTDQTFDPRLTGYLDGGLSLYPVPSDPRLVRIWLTYLGERRFTEQETAHGGQAFVQVSF